MVVTAQLVSARSIDLVIPVLACVADNVTAGGGSAGIAAGIGVVMLMIPSVILMASVLGSAGYQHLSL